MSTKMKVVYAPPASDSALLTSIYSIMISEEQEVEWQWLYLPDGNRVVVDYKVFYPSEADEIKDS
jgi:hypothetical protein